MNTDEHTPPLREPSRPLDEVTVRFKHGPSGWTAKFEGMRWEGQGPTMLEALRAAERALILAVLVPTKGAK